MNKNNLSKVTPSNLELFQKYKNNKNLTERDINEILMFVNGFNSFNELFLHYEDKCKDDKLAEKMFSRGNFGEPIEYILGKTDFLGLPLKINKNVLIPREETKELVIKLVDKIREKKFPRGNFLDICTGSGCIAIYLGKNLENFKGYASDISKKALKVAIENSKNNRVNIEFIHTDKCRYFLQNSMKFDILVSNPPYVDRKEEIDENVLKYEPIKAVYLKNGTYFYEYYFKNYKELMNEKFIMAFEVGYEQEEKLTKLINKYFKDDNISYEFIKDLYDKTRFLFIYKD